VEWDVFSELPVDIKVYAIKSSIITSMTYLKSVSDVPKFSKNLKKIVVLKFFQRVGAFDRLRHPGLRR